MAGIRSRGGGRGKEKRRAKRGRKGGYMKGLRAKLNRRFLVLLAMLFPCALFSSPQGERALDPDEPAETHTAPALLPRPAGAIAHSEIDEARLHGTVEALVACKTRNTLSSWTDPARGVGCGRDVVAARMNEIAAASGGKLQVVVD